MELVKQNKKAIYLSKEHTLLAKGIRVLKTQKNLTIMTPTKILLDVARDTENQLEALFTAPEDTIVVYDYSTILTLMEQTGQPLVSRKLLFRHMIKMGGFCPDYLIFIDMPFEAVRELRKKFDLKHKVENTYRGKGYSASVKRRTKLVDILNNLYGVKTAIIKWDQHTETEVADAILNFLGDIKGHEDSKPDKSEG